MPGRKYIYEHWRPDRNECFYVGQGTGRRANVIYNRNGWHTAIQKKLILLGLGVEIKIIASGLSKDEADTLEIERIAFWKADGADLANLTPGGDGNSDALPETRAKMRAKKLGGKLSEEHKAKIRAATKVALNAPGMHEKLSAKIIEVSARPEVKAKRSASQKARIRPPEHGQRISAALTGRKLSPEHIESNRRAHIGLKQSPETIEKRRVATTGKKRTAEFGEQMSAMWTPERKETQAEITRQNNLARIAAKRLLMTPEQRERSEKRAQYRIYLMSREVESK